MHIIPDSFSCFMVKVKLPHYCTWSKNGPFIFSELRITRGPENAVVLIGDRHTFHCSTKVTHSNSTDPETTISWQKDDQIITNRGSKNFRILRRSGKLRFAHVRKSDEGYYRCIAQFQSESEDPVKVHSSYAKLTVQGMGLIIAVNWGGAAPLLTPY